MTTLDDFRFFNAIAGAGSLAAAARDLGVSPSAVTQRLRALEERLGVRLLERSAKPPVLTDEGELLAERGRAILDEAEALDDALAERRGEVTGRLRIAAPLGFGRRHVAPLAARFQAEHPRVEIDLVLTDRLSSLGPGAWDIAVHVGETAGAPQGLMMRPLAPNARWLCAAPAYLQRRGAPAHPDDLAGHDCIALRENDEDVTLWRFTTPDGEAAPVRVRPSLASNDGEVIRAWGLEGRGLIIRSEWDVAGDVHAGRLVRLLDAFPLPDAPVIALLGSRRQARAARTARMLDALAAALRPAPWRVA